VYLDLRTATDQRLVLEVGIARAAMPEASLDAAALLARIERLERRLAIAPGDTGPAPAARAPADPAPPVPAPAAAPAAPAAAPARRPNRAPAPDRPAAASPAPAQPANAAKAASGPEQEAPADDWAEPPAPAPAAPVDLDLVSRSWPLVLERAQASSRMTASLLERGRLRALDGHRVVVEFSPQDRFYAEALEKGGRVRQVDAALEAVLGGGLAVHVVIGESVAAPAAGDSDTAGDPVPPPDEEPGPAAAAADADAEFDIDPDNDQGEPLDPDADARAVADLAVRELGGQVIEERRNDAGERRTRGSGAKASDGAGRARGPRARERSERGKR
jgi:DNA polymerase III subunit gamma/tau